MSETIDLSCPNGCFDLEVSGSHEHLDDREFLQDVAIRDDPGECPRCGVEIEEQEAIDDA